MKNLVRIFMKYKYSQSIWGDCVYNIINRNNIEQHFKHIYDAPGGAGFMSNNLRSRLCKDDTLSFFKQQGFDLIDSEDVINFNYLTYSNNKYFHFVLSFLFTLYEKTIRPKGSIYWVGLFAKSK